MSKLTNGQALELYNLLNNIKVEPGTHREYASAKTLRKMKEWITEYNDKVSGIDNDHCLTEDTPKGKVIVNQILKISRGVNTEEVAAPSYSKEGEEARFKAKKKLRQEPVVVDFEIHQTDDDAGLNVYEKIALQELGFLKSDVPEPKETKKEAKKEPQK